MLIIKNNQGGANIVFLLVSTLLLIFTLGGINLKKNIGQIALIISLFLLVFVFTSTAMLLQGRYVCQFFTRQISF